MPSAAPATASRSDSASSCRTIRPRLAPSARRSAISRRRAAPRASSRFATFAHAAASSRLTRPISVRKEAGELTARIVLAAGTWVRDERRRVGHPFVRRSPRRPAGDPALARRLAGKPARAMRLPAPVSRRARAGPLPESTSRKAALVRSGPAETADSGRAAPRRQVIRPPASRRRNPSPSRRRWWPEPG